MQVVKLYCLLCYYLLCGLCLVVHYGPREWMPQCVVDSHQLIMLTNIHTLTLHACLQVVLFHGVKRKLFSYALVSTTMHVIYMFMKYYYVSLNQIEFIGVEVWARV